MTLVDAIDAVLPQTQCGRCGFGGCLPYAEALAAGVVDVDRCPPGGDAGAAALAALVGRPARPVDPARGAWRPLALAVVDEARCIGCTLCIDACPVDAIAGAPKRMHDVIGALCTGCELCLPACPVDCIAMVSADFAWDAALADAARARHRVRAVRTSAAPARPAPTSQADAPMHDPIDRRRAIVDAAIARAAARVRSPVSTPVQRDAGREVR